MTRGEGLTPNEPRNRAERRAAQRTRRRRGIAIAGGASIVASGLQLISAGPAWAADYVVDTGIDDADEGLTLREAIADAGDGDVITFAGGVTDVEIVQGEIDIDNAITIQGPGVSIHPAEYDDNNDERLFYLHAAGDVTISGTTITGFTPRVYVDYGDSGAPYFYDYGYANLPQSGGAIKAADTNLTLSGVTVSGNRGASGGAVWIEGGQLTVGGSTFAYNESSAEGGALNAQDMDSVSITTTTFSGNESYGDGGVVFADGVASISITGSTFDGNEAQSGSGGGLAADDVDAVSITGSTFDTNTSAYDGGAIRLDANQYSTTSIVDTDITGNHAAAAAGIWLQAREGATATVTGSTISGNVAFSAIGGMRARLFNAGSNPASLTISDTTIEYNSAPGNVGGLYVEAQGDVSLDEVTVSHNTAGAGHGGAAFSTVQGELAITDSTFTENNAANDAAGLFVSAGQLAAVTISGAVIDGNTGGGDGGGLKVSLYSEATLAMTTSTVSGNGAATGAGISVSMNGYYDELVQHATITDTTIDDNTATGSGGGARLDAANGAIVFDRSTISNNDAGTNAGGLDVTGDVTLRSSTVSTNSSDGNGGGISASNTADVTVEHTTITGNTATGHGGGIFATSFTFGSGYGADVALDHSILAGNAAGFDGQDDVALIDTVFGPGSPAEPASMTATWSLIGDAGTSGNTDGTNGNRVGVDPLLGALAANGGPTKTHLPAHGSPAIDAGDPSIADAPATDQRGEDRVDDVIDIGSVEIQVLPPVTTTTTTAPPSTTTTVPSSSSDRTTTTTTEPPSTDPVVTPDGVDMQSDRMVVVEEGQRTTIGLPSDLAEGETESVEISVQTDAGAVSIVIEQGAGSEATSVKVTQLDVSDADVQTTGFTLLDAAFEVEVTGGAKDGENAGGTVCFPYDPDKLAEAGLVESDLVLFHFRDDGTREAVTTTVDTVNHRVCGHVDSFSPFAVGEMDTDRVAGVSAPRTAAAISAATFDPGVPVAYIVARGPDGLGAGAAAAHAGGPVLLVTRDQVPAATRVELDRLHPGRVVVVGGTGVISDAVVAQLGATRVAGADRYATAAALSAAAFDSADVVYVASGRSAADAMVASVAAAAAQAPLLLVGHDTIPGGTAAELARLHPGRVVVVGGTAAVSDAVAAALGAERVAGADRYATSAAVADALGRDEVFVTRGDDPVDAVSAIPAAAAAGAAILLVQPDAVPSVIADALTRYTPKAITVIGGTAAVSLQTEADLAGFLPAEG